MEGGDELTDVMIGVLVTVAYLAPTVVFALAIRPASEVVQGVGRSAATV
jgi:hypothetical protein